MADKPNILFIISDQHNAKVLGGKGHPLVQTPHLDQLASEGVRFDNAIAQCPICTPSRVSYFSGQYCHNHGHYGLCGPNPGGLPNILGYFRSSGYRTGAIGKIHCPEYWIEDDCDYFREVYPSLTPSHWSAYDDYLRDKGLLQDRDDGAYPEQTSPGQGIDGRASRLTYEDSVEGWVARETIVFMRRASDESRPFIVQASLPRPHQVYSPSQPFWDMYPHPEDALPPNADDDLHLKAPHFCEIVADHRAAHFTLFEPRTFEAGRLRKLRGYLGAVSQVDHAVGEMLAWLRQQGLDENTIVIYTSDHGDYACEHGMMEKAPGICSDAITRIPHIWRWPGHLASGHVAEEIIETVDVSATLCALAGLEPLQTSDGHDITALLQGQHAEIHSIGVTEFPWSRSVRKGQYRLVRYAREMFPDEWPGVFGELYDLVQDPWELENLYFEPAYAAVVQELSVDLLDWLMSTTRPVTVLGTYPFGDQQATTRFGCTTNADGKIGPERLRKAGTKIYL